MLHPSYLHAVIALLMLNLLVEHVTGFVASRYRSVPLIAVLMQSCHGRAYLYLTSILRYDTTFFTFDSKGCTYQPELVSVAPCQASLRPAKVF